MYYRRKVLLALLQSFNRKLGKINLQKLLFIVTRFQEKPAYDFVPYRMGGFSFQSYSDLRTLVKYGQVKEGEHEWQLKDKTNYLHQLKQKDRYIINHVQKQFEKYSLKQLIRYTYKNYPYYAIKSEVANKYLNNAELANVKNQKPKVKGRILYTIGYEGCSLETYLNKLIINDVKVLCDVRKNPFSRKYGFSKQQLQSSCGCLGIQYIHIPDLGINSEKRQNLKTLKDYQKLFVEYSKTTLKKEKETLNDIISLIKKNSRVAITCFEAHHSQCHRGKVAEALSKMPSWKYSIKHI